MILFSFSLPAEAAQEAAKKPETPAAAPAATAPATYVGSETCQACHEDIYNAFQKNPHVVVETDSRRGFEKKACESCHGPASKHAESAAAADIRNPGKIPVAEADRVCMRCHLNQPTHIGRIQASHAKNQVGCVSCHSMHKGQAAPVARKITAVNQQCASCHLTQWAQSQRPYRHRLPEGSMSCVDCHNPHGTLLPRSLQTFTENAPGCLRCHGDKRGPFVFEHAPVKLEGCTTCHEPHGSANPRMLVRAQVRFVCLECHANPPAPTPPTTVIGAVLPPAFHDLRSPRYQNCTICHTRIHGSYVDRTFLK